MRHAFRQPDLSALEGIIPTLPIDIGSSPSLERCGLGTGSGEQRES